MKPPALRRHATGQYVIYWGGKNHYLGVDRPAAEAAYAEQLRAWAEWRTRRGQAIKAASPSTITVADAVTAWLTARAADITPRLLRGYRTDIRPVLDHFGRLPIAALTPAVLAALKADLRTAGKSASTINHTIRAAKQMVQHAVDFLGAAPVNLRAVKLDRERRRHDLAQPPAIVAKYVQAAEALEPDLAPWLRLGFLTGARVGELVRLVHGDGRWHKPADGRCVFAVSNKTEHATDEPERYLVLSDEALEQLALVHKRRRPRWRSASGLSHAWIELFGPTPDGRAKRTGIDEADPTLKPLPLKFVRHSCYQALLDAGVEFQRARILMGHHVPGSWGNYASAPWHAWRGDMAKVTLRAPAKRGKRRHA